ncbi:alkaline phosphatase family protein [Halarchaeum salinum]|uniref:Type I phosphodiesterase / nucleotide pyrophosphatase n=1 Tax=Halarchaeum salinum TaxID=489912 RepID=A0AAV3S6P4_9EURY
MTLLILALDALDAALVDDFGIDALRLPAHGQMETVAEMRDEPYTPEAWASAATGLHPRDHGVSMKTSEWENPLVNFLSRFAGYLPMSARARLGNVAESATGSEYTIAEVESATMFDDEDRIVHNWPGVHNGAELKRAWDVMWREGQTDAEFRRDIAGLAAEQFGWAREMLRHGPSVAGVHIHYPDATGHAYCEDRESLRRAYERTGEFVAEIVAALGEDDELLVLSDHGMVVDWYADAEDRGMESGGHSWRAFAGSTCESVPESILDVREWVDEHATSARSDREEFDIDEERLRDLGYI